MLSCSVCRNGTFVCRSKKRGPDFLNNFVRSVGDNHTHIISLSVVGRNPKPALTLDHDCRAAKRSRHLELIKNQYICELFSSDINQQAVYECLNKTLNNIVSSSPAQILKNIEDIIFADGDGKRAMSELSKVAPSLKGVYFSLLDTQKKTAVDCPTVFATIYK